MPSSLALRMMEHFYGDAVHPYQTFEIEVADALAPSGGTLLDVGCGREAPVLKKFRGRARELVGVEMVEYRGTGEDVRLLKGSMESLPLPDQSVDVVMARSVMEHVQRPYEAVSEVARVLRPGGAFVFLTGNLWDYAALAANIVPNRFHPWIVSRTEGRAEEDTFPTAYQINTRRKIHQVAAHSRLRVRRFSYLSQYPNYLLFSAPLFLVGMAYEKMVTTIPGLGFLQGWILCTLEKPRSMP
jgi:SAM-dependent methyltransferase